MKINKQILDNIDKCYATCLSEQNGKTVCIGCSEGAGCAHAFTDGEMTSVWEEIGGTMNFVPVPNKQNAYFATRKFLPVFSAKECELNYVEFSGGKWSVTPIMNVPYLHRFDLYEKGGEVYFFGATLCESKEFQQDWSKPGSVYTAKLDKDLTKPLVLRELYKGITKNHGLWFEKSEGRYLVSGVEGVFSFKIPNSPIEDKWEIENVLPIEAGDVALCDVDGDGKAELATIEPFHGNKCRIYKAGANGYEKQVEFDIDFGHVLFGGRVAGENCFLLGYRRKDMKMGRITRRNGLYFFEKIDEMTGPSQISVLNRGEETLVLSANRQINELALYTICK